MSTNPQQLLQIAATNFQKGNLDEAERSVNQLLAQIPEQIDCLHLLALINKSRGKLTEAETLFDKCLTQDSARADIRSNLGNLYQSIGRIEEANQCYATVLNQNPDFRQARLALARILIKQNDFAVATSHASRLVEKNQQDVEALVVLGNSLKGQRQFSAAETTYKSALSLKPDYGAASHNLGALYVQTNRNDKAINQLEHAAKLGVSGPALLTNQAKALMGLGKFEEAEKLLGQEISSGNRSPVLLELITKLRYMRKEENFTSAFEESIRLDPSNANLHIVYARLLQGADKFDQAETNLRQYINSYENNSAIHCALAATQTLAGKYQEAVGNLEIAEKLDGNNSSTLPLMIDALMCLGEASRCQALIAQGRNLYPNDQWYLAMEATAGRLLGNGQYEKLYNYHHFVKVYELAAPDGWDSFATFNQELLEVLKERHRFNAHPLDQSLRHGTQTPTSLLWDSNELIQTFLQCLHKPIAEHRQQIGSDEKHPLSARNRGKSEMIGCWSVRLKQDGYHVNHVHPEGWLSSAFYVETPKEIESSDSHAGWLQFGQSRFPIPGVEAAHFIKPETGKLALFPSYMWHGTVPLKGTEPRTTIAFDVITVAD